MTKQQAIKVIIDKVLYPKESPVCEALETLIPELKEPNSVRRNKELIDFLERVTLIAPEELLRPYNRKDVRAWIDELSKPKLNALSDENILMIRKTIAFIQLYQQSNKCKNESDMQNSVTCENWLKSLL